MSLEAGWAGGATKTVNGDGTVPAGDRALAGRPGIRGSKFGLGGGQKCERRQEVLHCRCLNPLRGTICSQAPRDKSDLE